MRPRRRGPELESQPRARGAALSPANPKKSARCPVCGERADARFLARGERLEERVARRLARSKESWDPRGGACGPCVAWALGRARERDGEGSGPGRGGDGGLGRGGELLSAPARLRPNPNYLGRGVTVAVVDSDFVFHPDLLRPRPRIAAYVDARGPRARAGARPPAPYLPSWHGTMVAGAAFGSGWIAGGRFPGIATAAKLVLVAVARPTGRVGDAQVFHGLRWVVDHHQEYGIRVVNLSIGGDRPAEGRASRLDRLVERAVAEGIVVVAAAGNRHGRACAPPASAPEAITVGGLDDRGGEGDLGLYPGSFGETYDGSHKPDLVAPAIWLPAPMVPGTEIAREAELLFRLLAERPPEDVRAAIARRMAEQKYLSPHHQHVDGTSFAAALVSAVVAQILEANPRLTPAEVKACLLRTARPVVGAPAEAQGAGAVDAAGAVEFARVIGGEDPTNPRFESPAIDDGTVTYRFEDPAGRWRRAEWAGALGGWAPIPMRRTAAGLFELERPRPVPGRYPYKFLLPDGRWVADPRNPNLEADGFGDWNSVLVVRRR